jgi:UDP-N-acetylglucosamine--N-acetylmuramyl-(pentapeptide) pyrophosphoryl-undecaprenol N-acetylglucosamine transferase
MLKYEDAKILFVGARGKMEMSKVPEAGYEIVGLNVAGLKRRLTLENLLFPLKVISSFMASLRILKSFRPDVVVGFGGYASSPITLAAVRKQIPVVVQEQNSYAGLVNKIIGKKAQKICVAYEGMEQFFPQDKLVLTGNPVRDNITKNDRKRDEAMAAFSLHPDKKTILVIGGSLGAKTINDSIMQNMQQLVLSDYQVIWQSGGLYYEKLVSRMATIEARNIHLHKFITNMDLAYTAADLVISRAGALTISELCVVGKPVVFVPSPNVSEDHQTKNARALVSQDAAIMVTDDEAIEKLIDEAFALLEDDDRMTSLANNILALAKPNATEDITRQILALIK